MRRVRTLTFAAGILATLLGNGSPVLADGGPGRTLSDTELKATWAKKGIASAPRSTDSEFLRRVYLDLVGTIPTHDEAVAFLADADPKKREKLIDRLPPH